MNSGRQVYQKLSTYLYVVTKPVKKVCLNKCQREHCSKLVLALAAEEVLGHAVGGSGLGMGPPVFGIITSPV